MLIRFPSTFLTISSATPTYNHFIQATSASWNFLGQAKYASALGPLHLLFALLAMPLLQIPIWPALLSLAAICSKITISTRRFLSTLGTNRNAFAFFIGTLSSLYSIIFFLHNIYLTCYIFHLHIHLLSPFSPPTRRQVPPGQEFCLFCLLLYLQCLEQCLTYCSPSINIQWMNEILRAQFSQLNRKENNTSQINYED